MVQLDTEKLSDKIPIFWDHYGIQSPYSGIGRHAQLLRNEMLGLGFSPVILDPFYQKLKPLALTLSSQNLQQKLKVLKDHSSVIVHGLSNYNIPLARPFPSQSLKNVLTVHDLIPELLPNSVSFSSSRYLKFQMPRSLQRADVIISVSQWTKSLMEERYPFTRGKIQVIPNGMPAAIEETLHQGWMPSPCFLTVARGESYKRLSHIPQILRLCPPEWTWHVVTDERGIRELANRSSLLSDRRLTVHTNLSETALQSLFSKSWVYIHPSLLEGYCLPAAQALATGRPVIFTKSSGIDEVVGKAGIGLDKSAGLREWVEAMGEIVSQHNFYRLLSRERAECAPKWKEVATRTLEAYGIL